MILVSDTVKLQKITIEDQSRLMNLLSTIYPPAYKHLWINNDSSFYLNKFYSLKNLKLELEDTNARYYFVHYNSETVGIFRFVYNNTFPDYPSKKATYINRIYLNKTAQGTGLAQQLFNWVEVKSKQKKQTLIWLKAMDTQEQALRFYHKQNYSIGTPTLLDFDLIHPQFRGMKTFFKYLD